MSLFENISFINEGEQADAYKARKEAEKDNNKSKESHLNNIRIGFTKSGIPIDNSSGSGVRRPNRIRQYKESGIFESVQFLNEDNEKIGVWDVLKLVSKIPKAIYYAHKASSKMERNIKSTPKELSNEELDFMKKAMRICKDLSNGIKSSLKKYKNIEIIERNPDKKKRDADICIYISDLTDDEYEEIELIFGKFMSKYEKKFYDFEDFGFYGNETIYSASDSNKYPDIGFGASVEPCPGDGCCISFGISI